MSIAEIQHAVADLSEFDRGTLAAWLLESLPPHDAEDAGAARRGLTKLPVVGGNSIPGRFVR